MGHWNIGIWDQSWEDDITPSHPVWHAACQDAHPCMKILPASSLSPARGVAGSVARLVWWSQAAALQDVPSIPQDDLEVSSSGTGSKGSGIWAERCRAVRKKCCMNPPGYCPITSSGNFLLSRKGRGSCTSWRMKVCSRSFLVKRDKRPSLCSREKWKRIDLPH